MWLLLLPFLYLFDLFSPSFYQKKQEEQSLPVLQEESVVFSVLGVPFFYQDLLDSKEEDILLWKAAEHGFFPSFFLSEKEFKGLKKKAENYKKKSGINIDFELPEERLVQLALIILLRNQLTTLSDPFSLYPQPALAHQQLQLPGYDEMSKSLELLQVKITPQQPLKERELKSIQEILLEGVDLKRKKNLQELEKKINKVTDQPIKITCKPYFLGKTNKIPKATFMRHPIAKSFNGKDYKIGSCSSLYKKEEYIPSYNLYFLYVADLVPTTPAMQLKSQSDRLVLLAQRENKKKMLAKVKKEIQAYVHYHQ